jgi:hypothetical protein
MKRIAAIALALSAPVFIGSAPAQEQAARDGSHDFDFLIGDWKAHVRRLPERLVGSNKWVEYDGISNHKKLLDSNANFEEFDVRSKDGARIKAQTLRLYNPDSRQWSIYLVDLDKGDLQLPPVIGGSTASAANSTIRKSGRAARSWCAISGSTCRPRRADGTGLLRRRRQDLGSELGV